MTTAVEKIDSVMRQMSKNPGVYPKSVESLCSSVKYMQKKGIYRVTIDLPADQVGGNGCVREFLKCGESVKVMPIIVCIDPEELATELV